MAFLDVPSRHASQRFMRPRDNINANIDIDDFLSSDLDLDLDLELSFASNVSIHSPPPSEALMLSPNAGGGGGGESDYAPMDISPAPAPPPKNKEKKPSGRPRAFTSGARLFGRDMSNGLGLPPVTATQTQSQVAVAAPVSLSKSGSTSSKRIQRSALPLQWFEPTRTSEVTVKQANANVNGFSAPLPTVPASPGDDAMDVDSSYTALELELSAAPYTFQPTHPLDLNLDSSPTITSSTNTRSSTRDSGFNNLFYEPLSPRRSFESPRSQHQSQHQSQAHHRTSNSYSKRRSLSPEPCLSDPDFSSPGLGGLQSSPSQRKLERMSSGPLFPRTTTSTNNATNNASNNHSNNHSNNGNNGKPTLQGLGAAPSSNFLKRPRRPVVSAIVSPTDLHLQGASSAYSAYPIEDIPRALPPTRRAFSALLPPTSFLTNTNNKTTNNKTTNKNNTTNTIDLLSADESSFDADLDLDLDLDMSSPAQAYAKRQHGKVMRTIRRCDGMEDFRASGTGGTGIGMAAGGMQESPSGKYMSMSMSMSPGLPGFGDNEAHGKILPCRRVTEDGLMRITCHTLDDLLDGVYKSQITDFHIIDCRFDYEYNGGHIPGAVNINTTSGVEELLLGSGVPKPRPSVSGDAVRKTVLVFHCEFSAKRAPTFAKHLRAKDRALNNHFYPKIHYPEVYILEGGYCQYFKTSAVRCEPPAYVTMDDPTHAVSRREDLDQFRRAKFGRHKSYAYGDGVSKMSASGMGMGMGQGQVQQSKRNTAPSGSGGGGTNPLFAAANAARTRRAGSTNALSTLNEDGNMSMSMAVHSDGDGDGDDDDTDIGDSPCPPPTKGAAKGGSKGGNLKKLGMGGMGMGGGMGGRVPLVRAETYGPGRMQY